MPRGHASRKQRAERRAAAATTRESATFQAITNLATLVAAIPPSVNYREAADDATETCGNCVFMDNGECTRFDANVESDWVCDDWEAAATSQASIARTTLEAVRVALADGPMSGQCADCGHMAASHEGSMNDGACSIEGCDCQGMVAADDDDPEEVSAEVVAFAPSNELIEAAVAALTDQAPECAPIVRLRLEELRLVSFADGAVALPVEHQPGEIVPDRTAESAVTPAAPPAQMGGQLRWRASLVPEATLTDDGRAFAPDSIDWRELPLTLMAMIETTEGGHVGALVAGRIDRIWRDASGMLWGEGVFDDGDYGSMIGRLVGDGTLRGVSVDVAVHTYEVGPRSNWFDDDGNWAPKPEEATEEPNMLDLLLGGETDEPIIMLVTKGVIGAATVCPFQAFEDAVIELSASLVAGAKGANAALWTVTQQAGWVVTAHAREAAAGGCLCEGEDHVCTCEPTSMTASAAGLAPVAPPSAWFENPGLEELTPLVVTPEGRIYGHAAAWDTCHIGIPDVCTTAPHSNASYAYFLLKEVECEDGERVSCGTITLDAPHADRGLGRAQAAAHYDNTGMAAADVVAGEDEFGIWVAGAVRSTMDAEKVRALRGAVLSGDWRNVNGNLELVALLAVNVPGFPVPRTRAIVASGDDGTQVTLTLLAAGVHNGPVEDGKFVSPEALAKIEALRDVAAGRFSELAARARDAA